MSFFARNKSKIILGIVTLVFVIIMALSSIPKDSSGIMSNFFGILISPAQKVVNKVVASTEDFMVFILNMRSYEKDNEKLKEEISTLYTEVRETEDLKKENETLRNMLELKSREVEYDLVATEIISRESDNWYCLFTLDKGTNYGLKKNNAVITSDGLVGHIYEVGNNWAKVITIIDSTSSVGAVLKRTGDTAIIEGSLDYQNENMCKLTYLSKNASITEGDYIETSGMGGIYPSGLYIGRVKEIVSDPNGITQQAIVETAVNFGDLRQVFVIRGEIKE